MEKNLTRRQKQMIWNMITVMYFFLLSYYYYHLLYKLHYLQYRNWWKVVLGTP